MKFWLASLLVLMGILSGQSSPGLQAYLQSNVFYTNDFKPYVELRLYLLSNGLTKKIERDSLLTVEAQVTFLLKKDTSLVKAERLALKSNPSSNLSDIIQILRWQLPPGRYELETHIEDLRDPAKELSLLDSILIQEHPSKPQLSTIQLSSISKASTDLNHPFYKNGYVSEPLAYLQYNELQKVLYAYFETYHCQDLGKRFFYKFNLSKIDSFGTIKQIQEWHKARSARSFDAFHLIHDISNLTSGTYVLHVSLLDEHSKQLSESNIEFFRINPFWDQIAKLSTSRIEDYHFFDTLSETTIDYSIRGMYPIISSLDVSILNEFFKEKKLEEKRAFLLMYWSKQSDSARIAYTKFLKYIQKIDALFYSGFGYGFETARGNIFLRFGKPDEQIAEDKDNGAFPYEIWKYNKLNKTGQTNVKFLFYNPDLAGSDFRLLHSNAHGEVYNKNWELELYKNAIQELRGNNPIDGNLIPDGYNRRAREYFNN